MQAVYEESLKPPQSSFLYSHFRTPIFRFDWHYNTVYELTYIIKGSGKCFIGDNISDFNNGQLVLLGPNLPHTWNSKAGSDCEAIVIHFDFDFLGAEFFTRPEMIHVRNMLEKSAFGREFQNLDNKTISDSLLEMDTTADFERVIQLLKVLDLLAKSNNTRQISTQIALNPPDSMNESRFSNVCRYINDNYSGQISQTTAASLIHMSPSRFSQFFKRISGRSFSSYVNELRISNACHLLVETDKQITQICFDVGYNNISNFNRHFLKHKGITPSQYRSEFIDRSIK